MGIFLNSRIPADSYQATSSGKYYVDKTPLIAELIPAMGTDERFFCITRPRRFGKTIMAKMVGAFFGKSMDTDKIFRGFKIASPEITDQLEGRDYSQSIWDMIAAVYQKTGSRFVFVIDEWDAVFHMSFITDADREAYLLFLKSLLKDKFYVELAYMTGILPIARYHASHGTQESKDSFVGASGESLRAAFPADTPYSDGSELNMFQEYHMATRGRFGSYFGFLDSEVDLIFSVYLRTTSATLSGNSQTIAEILKYVHDTEVPILSYNREIELAAVVNLVYLAARDSYRIEREDKAGEGFVDFIFYPEQRNADAIILELKIDGSPDDHPQSPGKDSP